MLRFTLLKQQKNGFREIEILKNTKQDTKAHHI